MTQPEFTDDAAKILNDIHDYIGRDSPSAAGHFITMIEERCDTLAENRRWDAAGQSLDATSPASLQATT